MRRSSRSDAPPREPGPEPHLQLVDARAYGVDEAGLRRLARVWPAAEGASRTSRSYAFPYAAVAWHSDRVGVDIERIVPCDQRFGRSICTPGEARAAPWQSAAQIISLWSSKEALAKALGEALEHDPRRLESPMTWQQGAAGRWRARPAPAPEGHVAWICWRSADSALHWTAACPES